MVYSVPSLIPPASPPSLLEIEEAIEKVCREWRTRIQRLFDGMRRNLPVQSADTAAETGDSIQAHAIVKLLAGWNRAEKDSRNAIDTSEMKEKIRRLLSTGLSTKDIADCLICDELQFMEQWIGVSSCGRNPGIERFLREIVVQKAKAIRPPDGKGGEGAAQPDDREEAEAPPITKREKRAKWLAEAMLLVQDHPDWSDAEIARRVGRDSSGLSRSKTYQNAAAMARGSKVDRPAGYVTVDPDTGQHGVEAVAPTSATPDNERGAPIPGSNLYREYCADCEEPMRVQQSQVGKNPRCEKCCE